MTGFWFGGQSRGCQAGKVGRRTSGGILSPLCPGRVCRARPAPGRQERPGEGRESETSLPGHRGPPRCGPRGSLAPPPPGCLALPEQADLSPDPSGTPRLPAARPLCLSGVGERLGAGFTWVGAAAPAPGLAPGLAEVRELTLGRAGADADSHAQLPSPQLASPAQTPPRSPAKVQAPQHLSSPPRSGFCQPCSLTS